MNYRYKLDPSSKKYICPQCQKKKFVRYFDTQTNEMLSDDIGRCDSESGCGYHLKPEKTQAEVITSRPEPKSSTPYLPDTVLKFTKNDISKNPFFNFFNNKVSLSKLKEVLSLYHIGTIEHFSEYYCTFPYIDKLNRIRAVQAKTFDSDLHTKKTNFIHSILEKKYLKQNKDVPEWLQLYLNTEKKVTCLFGEHLLLKYPNNPIALVEAPKTAIICTLYFGTPKTDKDFIWLAVFNLSSLTLKKVDPIINRQVVLFPDLSKNGKTYEIWSDKARSFGSNFIVSNYLETRAAKEAKSKGLDLADYLLMQEWEKEPEPVEQFNETYEPEPPLFACDYEPLKAFFNEIELPTKPIQLSKCERIINVSLFIESHLNRNDKLHYNRLNTLRNILINNKNRLHIYSKRN